tara:strand:- start:441 stop:674 length:234 start_codon:yes stop_codon:yes gene_type:complete
MTGMEVARELEKRKGSKPSPGTIYPALKELKEHGFITADNTKTYSLTKKGEKELRNACKMFSAAFYDAKDMMSHCRR